ncbi:MAG: NADH:ubiquinone reductase (Na(+)-transporting) subunit C [Alistipes sp.]|jgi:Na+-transporting NADH:ubiquinone oxidoreductase subunit C|nr:NADH:ubiquinone reductase (Na(+)-transporting) subunit C [Alistipes sp.]
MKVNKNSSVYIITYATVMVVVVAAVLATAAMVLGPVQNANVERETKGAILASIGASVPTAEIEKAYAENITEIAIPGAGDLKLYESRANGKHLYIVPLAGSGLWGPIWGYVALEGDWNTISGVVFDHKGETPGLGAEITTPAFTGQFVGKKLFDAGGNLTGITVLKGAGASRGNDHAVDAISGGTITSRAVENMIRATLAEYKSYIETQRNNEGAE